jgi:hypothetical protein
VQTPFVGREACLAALDKHLQDARAGNAQYVAVEGTSGSGKSAVLQEFALLRRMTPEVFTVQLNAADGVLEYEFYVHLFQRLREQSEKVLHTLFEQTKRLRKVLAVEWDETEFRHVLASADWVQVETQTAPTPRARGKPADPLRQLLGTVHEHPWAVGAATILDSLARWSTSSGVQTVGAQRWAALLQALRARHLPDGAVLVLIIDQVQPDLAIYPDLASRWLNHWQAFATATRASALPLLVIWAGTPEALRPVRQALDDRVPLTMHTLGALEDEDYRQLVARIRRTLPRAIQEPWQRFSEVHTQRLRTPDILLLAAGWLAAQSETSARLDTALQATTSVDAAALVSDLVDTMQRRHPEALGMLRQLLAICAILPPGKTCAVDDLLPLCDLDAIGLDPFDGRRMLEVMLGECVRYGLLTHDVYAERYTVPHGRLLEIFQHLAYPVDTMQRQAITRCRRLAAAVMYHVQHGESQVLGELAQRIQAEDGYVDAQLFMTYLVAPLRRMLASSTKEERQHMAQTLGQFRSPYVIGLLTMLLNDQTGEVRSRAAQSLADLEGLDNCDALLQACRDSNSDVRWIAASALGRIDSKDTVDALIELLADEDKEVGRIAAKGLGGKGDARAVPHLIAAMRDNYPLLRESAALALGQLADRRALSALQDLLQDTNRQVRRSAEQALARLTNTSC